MSTDVITDYAFDDCYNLLDSPDLGKPYFEMLEEFFVVYHWIAQFPLIETFVEALPKAITRHMPVVALIDVSSSARLCLTNQLVQNREGLTDILLVRRAESSFYQKVFGGWGENAREAYYLSSTP